MVLVKKAQARILKKTQLSNLLQSASLLENPTHRSLETAVFPIFTKLIWKDGSPK